MKPLTVLVGENSSGKSTFLALARLTSDLLTRPLNLNFNEAPFSLGSFEQIISRRRGPKGRFETFKLGGTFLSKGQKVEILSEFTRVSGQPLLSKWEASISGARLVFKRGEPKSEVIVEAEGASEKAEFSTQEGFTLPFPMPLMWYVVLKNEIKKSQSKKLKAALSDLETFFFKLGDSRFQSGRPFIFAPVRSKPHRTYDPIREAEGAEGAHAYMVLAELSAHEKNWQRIRSRMLEFGQQSGLFKDVSVRTLGKKGMGPFQIRIKVSKGAFNLVDVGYGVSQILPILLDIIRSDKGAVFGLQQPEVHLHPKAQAAFASFLCEFIKQDKKRFIVETHSDSIIDRIRLEVRKRKHITHEDVQILYFERMDGTIIVHPIDLDRNGNLVNPPETYRQFFLEEDRQMLGI